MTKTQALPARSSPLSKQARPASRGSTGMPLNVAEKETEAPVLNRAETLLFPLPPGSTEKEKDQA